MKQKLLLLLTILFTSLTASAYDFEVDGIYYNTLSLQNLTCEVTYKEKIDYSYSSPYSGNFVIPSTVTYSGKTFSVTAIGDYAFYRCKSLTSVTIPNSVTEIGDDAFSNCSGLTSVTIPNSVTEIGIYAFYACSGLTSVTIPNSVTEIGSFAFSYCSGLTSVTIPNSVTEIGWTAFKDCSGLTSVTIGNSVKTIRGHAFRDCSGLKEITSLNTTPPTVDSDTFDGVSKTTCVLKVPAEAVDAYKAADGWGTFWNIEAIDASGEEELTEFTLADGEAYTAYKRSDNVDITYSRDFSITSWQPLYVPFSIAHSEWSGKADIAELAGIHMYEDGRTIIEFLTVTSDSTLANKPYVIRPKATGNITLHLSGKRLEAAPAAHLDYISCGSARYTFKIYGNYQPVAKATLNSYGIGGAYVMGADNSFGHAGADLEPQRFYIVKEVNDHGYLRSSAEDEKIYLMVDGEIVSNITTGIEVIQKDETMEGDSYNLWGQKVGPDYKGIVIQNGKKFFRK